MYSFFGLVEENEPVAITFEEVGKAAGHVCPTVAGAYLVAKRALKELYGDELPIRGNVKVTIFGAADLMVNGPIAQVFNHILGSAPITGFAGLGGKYRRRNLLTFKEDTVNPGVFEFERVDTRKKVRVAYNPEFITPREQFGDISYLLNAALSEGSSKTERNAFATAWLTRVFDILDNPEKVLVVEEIK